jgi:uncharacterized protein (TIGR02001 family)
VIGGRGIPPANSWHHNGLKPWGATMNTMKTRLAAVAAAVFLTGSAMAADIGVPRAPAPPPPPAASVPFDFIFGVRALTDYNFRGISQTDRSPGAQAYGEFQFLDNFLYVGAAANTVDLPTKPLAEIDILAGIRPKFGPVTLDLGVIQYWYPDESRLFLFGVPWTVGNTDFTELAAKVSWNYEDTLILGANLFYAWDWLGTGADGTYGSVTAKYNLPFLAGLSVSAELGHYWLGTTSPQTASVSLPDYFYWNAGVSYTWKNATLDLRYHDTDLSKGECFTLTADPRGITSGSGRSKWCSETFIATLSLDFVGSQLGIFAPAK